VKLLSHWKRWHVEWMIVALCYAFGGVVLASGDLMGFLFLGIGTMIAEMPITHYWLTRNE
jgi:hypothetical protein